MTLTCCSSFSRSSITASPTTTSLRRGETLACPLGFSIWQASCHQDQDAYAPECYFRGVLDQWDSFGRVFLGGRNLPG
eukprot:5818216-Pyramimonas_sp.AAC.1